MKKSILLAVLATVSICVAYGSEKKPQQTDYEYQQFLLWKQQQQQQQPAVEQQPEYQQRPTRVLRTTEPCIELAQAEDGTLRAYGTATSYVEKTALSEAERDARNRLALMIKVAVEGAAQDYERNANENMKNTAGSLGEAIMTQFVAEEIQNTRIIKTSIYDLSDGSIQVYVCIEVRATEEEFVAKLENELDETDMIGLQADRERFLSKMSEGIAEYKRNKMAEE